jgi:hypothetical protein
VLEVVRAHWGLHLVMPTLTYLFNMSMAPEVRVELMAGAPLVADALREFGDDVAVSAGVHVNELR